MTLKCSHFARQCFEISSAAARSIFLWKIFNGLNIKNVYLCFALKTSILADVIDFSIRLALHLPYTYVFFHISEGFSHLHYFLILSGSIVLKKKREECLSLVFRKIHLSTAGKASIFLTKLFFSCGEKSEDSKAAECFTDFQPASVYHLHSTKRTGAGFSSVCTSKACVCACVNMGCYYLKSTPTMVSWGRTRPGRKSTKATVSTLA